MRFECRLIWDERNVHATGLVADFRFKFSCSWPGIISITDSRHHCNFVTHVLLKRRNIEAVHSAYVYCVKLIYKSYLVVQCIAKLVVD